MSMSSVPCSSSVRFLYWSFSFIDVDTLLPLEVDRLLHFAQRSEQPCPLSRFKSTSTLRTKIGDSALAHYRQFAHRLQIGNGPVLVLDECFGPISLFNLRATCHRHHGPQVLSSASRTPAIPARLRRSKPRLRYSPGLAPTTRLKALLNAA